MNPIPHKSKIILNGLAPVELEATQQITPHMKIKFSDNHFTLRTLLTILYKDGKVSVT